MQSFYDEVSIVSNNFEILVSANIHYQMTCVSAEIEVSIPLSGLVNSSLYSIVQAKRWGQVLVKLQVAAFSKGVVQEIIEIDNLSSTKVTRLGGQVCRRRYSTAL